MMSHGSEWLANLGEPMRDSLYEVGMALGRRQHTETTGGVEVLLGEFVGADAGAIFDVGAAAAQLPAHDTGLACAGGGCQSLACSTRRNAAP